MILKINFPKRGQKLTNGDVIKAFFPKTPTGVRLDFYGDTKEMVFTTSIDWWNAVYEVTDDVKKMYSNGYIGEAE